MPVYLAGSIGRAIEKNDIDLILARDLREPFREETRKAKRNLITASFAAILVAAMDIQVNSFAGLSAASGAVASDITRGLVCLTVIYFLIGYLLDALLDYTAWRIDITRLNVVPYLLLVRAVERTYRNAAQQMKNVTWSLDHLSTFDAEARAGQVNSKNHADAIGQIKAIEKTMSDTISEVRPLLVHWNKSLGTLAFQADSRRLARAARMWAWDLILPLLIAGLAIARTFDGVWTAVLRLLGYSS